MQFPRFLFQGQADLLQHTKAEVQDNMKQIHDAALTGNLTKEGVGVRRAHSLPRRGQDEKPFAKRANDQQVKEDASKPPPQLHWTGVFRATNGTVCMNVVRFKAKAQSVLYSTVNTSLITASYVEYALLNPQSTASSTSKQLLLDKDTVI